MVKNNWSKIQSPALLRVIAQLEKILANPEQPLPSVRSLAQQCKVCNGTAQKGISHLRERGLISTEPRVGILRPGLHQPPATPAFPARWRQIWHQIHSDLQRGQFPRDRPLPGLKELGLRYQCTPTPVRRALSALVISGTLQKHGRNYFQATPKKMGKRSSIVRLLAFTRQGTFPVETQRELDFFMAVEEECRISGLELHRVGYEDYGNSPRFVQGGKSHLYLPSPPANLLGTLLASWHMQSPSSCIEALRREGLPLAIWSESENPTPPPQSLRKTKLRYFDIGYGQGPGIQIAKTILQQGLNKVAYISPFHASAWSKDRWLGLQEILQSRQVDTLLFARNEFHNPWSVRDRIEKDYNWKSQSRIFLKNLDYDPSLPPALNTPLEEALIEYKRNELLWKICEPLFIGAAQAKCQAWVLANDLVALLAQAYLQTKNSTNYAPQLLAGFDNSPSSLRAGLNSFEFDTRSLVRAMLGYILHPQSSLYSSGEIIRPPGFLLLRNQVPI